MESAPGRGRPRDYCSRACQAKAYRARQREAAADRREVGGAGSARGEAEFALAPETPGAVAPGSHLSVERIVAAAIDLADADGLENLHMRRLAAHLGAGTMSLYRHVGGREELIDLMVAAALGEEPQPDPAPGGWRAGLEYTARRDWGLYRRHPWILRYAMVGSRMRWSEAAAADGERAFAAFDGLGLTADEQLRLLFLVIAFTQGLALIHVNDVELTRRTGTSGEQWYAEEFVREPWHSRLADYPRLTAVFADHRPYPEELERLFEQGLQDVLDGIGVTLAGFRAGAGAGNAAD
ncbi:TetR/AcrR family transcriptional regulator C-terminal domain-containing protein [Yinghuangia soli]|uniref:TetR/AcrR family transcriptional regulator C-terminal domain-containing protein n=1 Tax=Yinghuangia soli TaxID=2908204 RepID=A0AA41PZ50_9ACTN|nr:TetR/AcrR family transcriptional regulator C-terminal domain-containing protein [Yinghuangia soli]MCF2528468.1 TetR/AcrR family transcriptional regulator C-terminal domain-containing protein [Yinghuangia soli]